MAPDLKPGPEMDRAVYDAVDWEWVEVLWACGRNPNPSISISDAIAALEATGCPHRSIIVDEGCAQDRRVTVELWWPDGNGTHFNQYDAEGATIPEAACLAILAWHKAKEGV